MPIWSAELKTDCENSINFVNSKTLVNFSAVIFLVHILSYINALTRYLVSTCSHSLYNQTTSLGMTSSCILTQGCISYSIGPWFAGTLLLYILGRPQVIVGEEFERVCMSVAKKLPHDRALKPVS